MKSLPEMERLKEGLCSLGLMDAMKKKFLNQCSLLLKLFLQQVGSLIKIYFNSLVRVSKIGIGTGRCLWSAKTNYSNDVIDFFMFVCCPFLLFQSFQVNNTFIGC